MLVIARMKDRQGNKSTTHNNRDLRERKQQARNEPIRPRHWIHSAKFQQRQQKYRRNEAEDERCNERSKNPLHSGKTRKANTHEVTTKNQLLSLRYCTP